MTDKRHDDEKFFKERFNEVLGELEARDGKRSVGRIKNKEQEIVQKISSSYDEEEAPDPYFSLLIEIAHTLDGNISNMKEMANQKIALGEDTSLLYRDMSAAKAQHQIVELLTKVYQDLVRLNRIDRMN